MTQFVVDANVAIKWVLPETGSSNAFRLLSNDYQLLVPDFFFSEIGNVLWKRVCRGEISLRYAHECLTEIISTPLEIHASHFQYAP